MTTHVLTVDVTDFTETEQDLSLTVSLPKQDFTASKTVVISSMTKPTTNGVATFDLIPNVDGTQNTKYQIVGRTTAGTVVLNAEFQMPDADSDLRNLVDAVAVASKQSAFLQNNQTWSGVNTFAGDVVFSGNVDISGATFDYSVVAGAGLTGGGLIGTNPTLNVGAGTGVTVNADSIAIGQPVAITDDVTFNNLTLNGDLTLGQNNTFLKGYAADGTTKVPLIGVNGANQVVVGDSAKALVADSSVVPVWNDGTNNHTLAVLDQAQTFVSGQQFNGTTTFNADGIVITGAPSVLIAGPASDNNWYGTVQFRNYTGSAGNLIQNSTTGMRFFIGSSAVERFRLDSSVYMPINSTYIKGTLSDGVTRALIAGITSADYVRLGDVSYPMSLYSSTKPSWNDGVAHQFAFLDQVQTFTADQTFASNRIGTSKGSYNLILSPTFAPASTYSAYNSIVGDQIASAAAGSFTSNHIVGNSVANSSTGDVLYNNIVGSSIANSAMGGVTYNVVAGASIAGASTGTVYYNNIVGSSIANSATGDVFYNSIIGFTIADSITGSVSESLLIGGYVAAGTTNAINLNRVIALSTEALRLSSASNLSDTIAIGYRAGYQNAYNSPALFGRQASASADNQVVVGSSFYTGGLKLDAAFTRVGNNQFIKGSNAAGTVDVALVGTTSADGVSVGDTAYPMKLNASNQAATVADATDLTSAITLVNALKAMAQSFGQMA